MPRLLSRLTLTAAALSALFVCSGWSLFGSDDDKDSKKPQAAPTQAQQLQAANSAAGQPASTEPSPMLPSTNVDAEVAKAHALREQGNYDEATRTLGQLMLAAPDDARVVGEYGKALAQQGSSKDAVAFLTRATQLNARDWTLYSALGVAYDQMDDHKSAHAAYDRALALKPGDPTVLNNYAVSLMLTGEYAGAERMLAQAKGAGDNSPKIASNYEMLAAMKSRAQSAASASPSHSPAVAAKAPAYNPNTTVMQAVPKDDHAGAVTAQASHEPHKLTTPAAIPPKTKMVAKPAAPKPSAPALRTADQGE